MPTKAEVLRLLRFRDVLTERDMETILDYVDQEVGGAGGGIGAEDANGNITVGSTATVAGIGSDNNIVIGIGANADADFTDISIAIGGGASVLNSADGAIAFGENASVDGSADAIAIGTNASVATAAAQGIAIGTGVTAITPGQLIIGSHIQTAELQTTDATVTQIAALTIFSNTARAFEVIGVGINPVTGDVLTIHLSGAGKRVGANPVALIGVPDELRLEDVGAAAWDIAINTSTSQVIIEVTGEAATTINWDVIVLHTIG